MGLPLRPVSTAQLIDLVVNRARCGLRTTVCYANAHTVNLACANERYRRTLQRCELLIADGVSVVWASRWRRPALPERITAVDYFPRLLERCIAEGLGLYLLGGTEAVIDRARRRLQDAHPDLRIAGFGPGYFEPAESARQIADIRDSGADILLVGMSSPRQEYWLADNADDLRPPVRWCVGALFDYVAGVEPPAPAWLCRMGCEWLFRLCVDPRGKWRRYLLGNPLFVYNAVRRGRRAAPPDHPPGDAVPDDPAPSPRREGEAP